MKGALRGALLAAAGVSAAANGAEAERPDGEEIIVTAARVEQSADEVIGAVTVITRKDIERRAVQSTQDLLRGEAGVDVVNSGGFGKLSSIFVRGADSEQVLVLIDGVRVGSATLGTTRLEFLPVDQIERIEIVRGPRSSLYGSDAIGGVIQIFTRRAQGVAVALGAGSHATYDARMSLGVTSGQGWLNASVNHIQTDGFNACDGAPTGGGCFTREPDHDSYDNLSGTLRAGYRWGELAQIEATALHADGNTQFDGSFVNETDFTQQVLTVRGKLRPRAGMSISLVLGDSRDDQESYYSDPFARSPRSNVSYVDTSKRHASLQADFTLDDAQLLTVGLDYVEDEVDSDVPFAVATRDTLGVFGQYQVKLGRQQLLLSARQDDNEQFGDYTTGSIGWKTALSERLSLTASWGRAFGAPTFNDLYFPGASNPNLDPETSHNVELGLAGRVGTHGRWSLTAFENRIEDLIVFDLSSFTPRNLNDARIRGIEAQASAALDQWTLSLGYTGLDPRNRSPGTNDGNFLPRRARHYGHLELGRSFGPIDARARLTASGARYDNVDNSIRVAGYATLDLIVDYALNAQWSLQAKVGNALDREYRTVHLFNQDDRTFFVNARYQR